MSARCRSEAGFTLIEVLVTIVVMSLGLLGLAGLLVTSLKVNQGAEIRSQAAWLANDIVDQMRGNRAEAQAATRPYNLQASATPGNGNSRPESELRAWRARLAQALPGGRGGVDLNGAASKLVVTIEWDDSHANGNATESFVLDTRL